MVARATLVLSLAAACRAAPILKTPPSLVPVNASISLASKTAKTTPTCPPAGWDHCSGATWPPPIGGHCCSQSGWLGSSNGHCAADLGGVDATAECCSKNDDGVLDPASCIMPCDAPPTDCTGNADIDAILHDSDVGCKIGLTKLNTVYTWQGFCDAVRPGRV